MIDERVNRFFKIGLLFIALGFLWIFYSTKENGRYVSITNDEQWKILDTRTGDIYAMVSEGGRYTHIAIIRMTTGAFETINAK
jgi:hypothetical protein